MNDPESLHPTDSTLVSYASGGLNDASTCTVKEHLKSCPSCQRRLGQLAIGDSAGPAEPKPLIVPTPRRKQFDPYSSLESDADCLDLGETVTARRRLADARKRRQRQSLIASASVLGVLAVVIVLVVAWRQGAFKATFNIRPIAATEVRDSGVQFAKQPVTADNSKVKRTLEEHSAKNNAEDNGDGDAQHNAVASNSPSRPPSFFGIDGKPNHDDPPSSKSETSKSDNSRFDKGVAFTERSDLPKPAPQAQPASPRFFNGKNLDGWDGQSGFWRVRDGAIVGSLPAGQKAQTFLYSKEEYQDFDLKFQVRLTEGIGIGGVQFRSKVKDATKFTVVGPQCTIRAPEAAKGYPAGSLRTEPSGKPDSFERVTKLARFFKDKEFNHFQIRCQGKHVIIKVNGITTVNSEIPASPAKGIIAWQLDGGPSAGEVIFKKIEFTDLTHSKFDNGVDRAFVPKLAFLKAEARYTAEIKKAQDKFLIQFDVAIKKRSAKPSSPDYALADVVKAEKEAFKNKGFFPWSEPMRGPLQTYVRSMSIAQEHLSAELAVAASDVDNSHTEKALESLTELAGSLLAPHVVGIWKGPRGGKWRFFSDGTFLPPGSADEGPVRYWSLEEDVLYVAHPAKDDAEAYNLGAGLLAPDGKSLTTWNDKGEELVWRSVEE